MLEINFSVNEFKSILKETLRQRYGVNISSNLDEFVRDLAKFKAANKRFSHSDAGTEKIARFIYAAREIYLSDADADTVKDFIVRFYSVIKDDSYLSLILFWFFSGETTPLLLLIFWSV